MADMTNYGIANAGAGNINFADSPITYGSGAAPAVTEAGGPVAEGDLVPVPPVTNTGPGTVTFGGEQMAFGPGGMRASAPSRWGDAAGGRTAPTQGGGGGTTGVAEFNDHAAIRRFAQEINSLGEGSDFVQTIKACHGLDGAVRDLGGDMNLRMRAFVDAAIVVAAAGDALRESAGHVAKLSQDLSGDE